MNATMISAIISGCFLIVGAILAFWGTYSNTKAQKQIAKMQIDERLIAENKIAWSNETRKLIAEFIRRCFELNQIIKDKQNSAEMKRLIYESVQNVTDIQLHFFDSENALGTRLLDEILNLEQHYSKYEPIPSADLSFLTEIARQYFEQQWNELTNET